MKKTILITMGILLVGGIILSQATASKKITFLDSLNDKGVTYIAGEEGNGLRVLVYNKDTDPRVICELADNFPDEKVVRVKNYATEVVAYCATP